MDLSTVTRDLLRACALNASAFVLRIDRNDMPGKVNMGDFILFDTGAVMQSRDMVLAQVGKNIVLRRYIEYPTPDRQVEPILMSSNPRHRSINLDDAKNVEIIAVAVEHYRHA